MSSQHHQHTERFHALDATRAFALLLGVVFHAVWTFQVRPMGGATMDVSSHIIFDWFFEASHTFRMQVFFLIAGFFARFLLQRRGAKGMISNRLKRIGIPLLASWLILSPLVIGVWSWGRSELGAMPEVPNVFVTAIGVVLMGLIFVPLNEGGAFVLVHLWFLYYLLLMYGFGLLARWLITDVFRIENTVRNWGDACVKKALSSSLFLAGFSLLNGLFLWKSKGWMGVDTPGFSLIPVLPALFVYGAFILLAGFCIARQSSCPCLSMVGNGSA